MDDKARQIRIEYYRKWRTRNKEKIKGYNKRYWEKKMLKQQEPVDEETTQQA